MRIAARSKQRGFIYLTTGANGAGKTLNTLKTVRERQLKENREVYHNGRFEMSADFGWKQIEFNDWQSLPDGAIILLDECQNDLPPRAGSAPPPEPVRMLAEHRRRGFDFYLITQHPLNIDAYVRRLIGSPGWHRHLKRPFGAELVSQLEWAAVNTNCEKTGAGKDANVSMVPFPKEVFTWYKSASLHTAKPRIPKQVYVFVFLALLIPALIYGAIKVLQPKPLKAPAAVVQPMAYGVQGVPGGYATGRDKKPLTPEEYAQTYLPRIPGFPQSAARFDAVQTVTQAPKPAACITGKRPGESVVSCKCYTQQATPLDTPLAVCQAIAAGGYFDDTLPVEKERHAGGVHLPPVAQSSAVPAPVVVAESTGYGLRNSAFLETRNQATASIIKPDLGRQPL